jgi:hypothetical protein
MSNGFLGPIRANLIVEFDNEKGYEFRVQCEAKLLPDPKGTHPGPELLRLLSQRNADNLEEAKRIALANLHNQATPVFREIVRMAFDDNIAHLRGRSKDTAVDVTQGGEARA